MQKNNIICEKSFSFALRIIKLYQHLSAEKKNLYYLNNYCGLERLLEQILKKQWELILIKTFSLK